MSTNPHDKSKIEIIKKMLEKSKHLPNDENYLFDYAKNIIKPKKTEYGENLFFPQKKLEQFFQFQKTKDDHSKSQTKKQKGKNSKTFLKTPKQKKSPISSAASYPRGKSSIIDDVTFDKCFKKNKSHHISEEDLRRDMMFIEKTKELKQEKKQESIKNLMANLKTPSNKPEPIQEVETEDVWAEIFGTSSTQVEKRKESNIKNKKLEYLLVGENKPSFSLPKPQTKENKNTIDLTNENGNTTNNSPQQPQNQSQINLLNPHINPLRKSANENFYKYFKFSKNEIFEKVLDFEFFKTKSPTVKVPDTFQSDNHYKYVWITNFFYELQHSLLRDKAESIEVENYIEMDVCVNFLYATELEDKISLFRLNTNKKLCDLKKKVLKENDIVAFYPSTINISSNDISFKNEKDKYYFIGIISINDSNETLCKVHYKSADKFSLKNQKGNTIYYTTRYLGNLTSSLREYNAVLNLELSNFTGILFANELFNKTEQPYELNQKAKIFVDNIKKCTIFNQSQTDAIVKASQMKTKDILLIQGPPGTGKTHTILGLLSLFLINNDGKILVCAPSNTAIDEISARIAKRGVMNEKLLKENVSFIRFGLYDRKEREKKYLNTSNGKLLQNYSLENLSDDKFKNRLNNINNEIENLNRKINDLSKVEKGDKKSYIPNNFELNELKSHRHNLLLSLQDVKSMRKNYEYELLSKTRILCTTLNSSGSERIKKMRIPFDYLIIDEACQCVEPSALIPLCHQAKKLIMVGDHMQLPATVFSDNAAETLYNRSLFERLINNNYPRHILTIQYRMHPNIRNFIGNIFYDNHLKDAQCIEDKMKNEKIYKIINEKYNFSFFDIAYGTESFDADRGKSYSNRFEADFVIELIKRINAKLSLLYTNKNSFYMKKKSSDYFSKEAVIHNKIEENIRRYKYAIITPYKSQVKYLMDQIRKSELINLYFDTLDIEVNTVDSFQGQERDIVIFSTVRSNFSNTDDNSTITSGIGFLNDFRRMNVALSRAKFGCYIVGNACTLTLNNYWKKLIEFCISNKCLFRAKSQNDAFDKIQYLFLNSHGIDYDMEIEENGDIEEGELYEVDVDQYLGKKVERRNPVYFDPPSKRQKQGYV